jgi:hypothetical protein
VSRVNRALGLLQEARQLLASAGPHDHASRSAASRKAQQAKEALRGARKRASQLLAAEAQELHAAADVAYDDIETGIGGLIGAASRYLELGSGIDARRGLARVARRLAGVYTAAGLRDRAAQFALEYLRALPDSDRDLFAIAYAASALSIAGRPDQLAAAVGSRETTDYPEPARSILVILEHRAGSRAHPATELTAAARGLTYVPLDLRVQCTLFAANGLIHQGEASVAVQVLSDLRAGLAADPMTDARLAQAAGAAAARAGDLDASLRYYLVAWTRYDDLRYRVGSMGIRHGIDGQLVRCRAGALAAAARGADWRGLLELIESCRLQATLDVPGSVDEVDETLATGVYRKRPSAAAGAAPRIIDVSTLPEAYQAAVGDLLDNRADVNDPVDIYVGGASALAGARAADGLTGPRPRLNAEAVMGRCARHEDLWWSSWYENGVLYWVLACDGLPVDGGAIDLIADEGLREALSVASLRYRIQPPWPVPAAVADVDLTHYLELADSVGELQLTAALARLLPPAARTPGEPGRRLIIASASELAAVPWPILPVDLAASPVTRLVERFELRFAPSLAILDRLRHDPMPEGAEELPFLLACDYFPADASPTTLPRRPARTVLAAREQCNGGAGQYEATAVNVARFLRSVLRGTNGVAFFRTHYEWVDGDPGMSGIALADGVFPSGILGARDPATGQTLLSLPSTVVFSCCSSAGSRERSGGETLGLAPLAMMAGARRLIVTSVEIRHTPFTVALDDMLIEVAVKGGDHFSELRTLQLAMLNEWRLYSRPDIAESQGIVPAPDIWAHYQAFGSLE